MNFKSSNIGKHLLLEPAGTCLTEQEKQFFKRVQPAGYMFRARNFDSSLSYKEWHQKFTELLAELRDISNSEQLIFSIDHEGGRVVRTPDPITRFPQAIFWKEKTAQIAEASSLELLSCGINLNFAPVLDIHSNPENPVIAERAFGITAKEVCNYSQQFLESAGRSGIQLCGKHFPGHGDTDTDSHKELPVIDHPIELVEKRELVPFVQAISNGIPAIMTAHVMFPALDPDNPATLSVQILQGLLRDKLGFDRVLITDALGMLAVRSDFVEGDGASRALMASADLLLFAGDNLELSDVEPVFERLLEQYRNDKALQDALARSKSRLAPFMRDLASPVPYLLNQKILDNHRALKNSVVAGTNY